MILIGMVYRSCRTFVTQTSTVPEQNKDDDLTPACVMLIQVYFSHAELWHVNQSYSINV